MRIYFHDDSTEIPVLGLFYIAVGATVIWYGIHFAENKLALIGCGIHMLLVWAIRQYQIYHE